MHSHNAEAYLALADRLRYLSWTKGFDPTGVAGNARIVLNYLEKLEFSHSLSAHGPRLKQWIRNIEGKGKSLSFEHTKGIPEELAKDLEGVVRALSDSVFEEASKRDLLILDRNTVGKKLRSLESTINKAQLKADQKASLKAILQDTIRCLECGAHRAAMVMGWSLAYEHLRLWIFAKALAEFNKHLVQKYRSRSKPYDKIVEYDDFFELGERLVIDIGHCDAKIIGKDSHKVLVDSLNTRNRFAHPNFSQATPDISKGYIDQLIINIIDHPQFSL